MPCDDNDACTTGETYDVNCNCVGGVLLDLDNNGVCNLLECVDFVFDLMNGNATESRISKIGIESNNIVQPNSNIDYNAGDYVLLKEGFEVAFQAIFHAFIEGCQ